MVTTIMEHNSYTVMLAKIRAFRSTKEVMAKALSDYDVTIMHWLALGAIEKQGGQATAKKIAYELNVTLPLITRFTKVLSSKNFINIKHHPEDKRTKIITLTSKGEKLLEMTEPVVRSALGDWLTPIPREQVKVYISVLLQVAYKLDD